MDKHTGRITDIQGFSTDNGPGIRTTIFLKGCSLRCTWCHNPETLSANPQLLVYPQRCVHCGRCVPLCPLGCHTDDGAAHTVRRESCIGCGICAAACRSEALVLSGREITAEQLLPRILADKPYYDRSGGGLTLSGGEPLLQARFCAELAGRCAASGVSTLIDTAACVDFSSFEMVLPYVRQYYIDLKCPDELSYRRYTGGSLERVIDNLRRLSKKNVEITIRIPIIPGINDHEEACSQMAALLTDIPVKAVHLLPFHRLGTSKYDALGLDYPYAGFPSYTAEALTPLLGAFQNLPVSIA